MKRLPKYVHAWVDTRHRGAKARHYFRRPGFKRVPLPGMPWSAEFMMAYQAALGQEPNEPCHLPGTGHVKPGSIGALIVAWFAAPRFLTLAPSTQRVYRGILEPFAAGHGDKPLAALGRDHIESMLAKRVGTSAAANHWLRLVKMLMKFAVRQRLRADDPSAGINFLVRRTTGFHTWSEQEIARYEARHPIGSKARLALGLLLYTAQRRSDVVKMGRQHVRGDVVYVRQQKTGTPLAIPLHPELAAIIAATPRPSEQLTFLLTEFGQPFTSGGFGIWLRKRCNEAGLPKECAAHGLRKAACRRLAEAGCSANVIASISGHMTLREVERYTKAADQVRMARIGMAAITSRTEIDVGGKRPGSGRKAPAIGNGKAELATVGKTL